MKGLPEDTAESADFRYELAHDWLDAAAVSELLGSAGDAGRLAMSLRRSRHILGVWLEQDGCFRFPPWQFCEVGVVPQFRELLAVVREGVACGRETSGWEEVDWFVAPHARLYGRRPSEMLTLAPDTVLELARREFSEGADARW